MAAMKGQPAKLWERAVQRLQAANRDLDANDPDGAANRAYYAAFHAVSALFAAEDLYFSHHFDVQQAVDKLLVQTERWDQELYVAFTNLNRDRKIADYGGDENISFDEAEEAVEDATAILTAVHDEYPELFPAEIELDIFEDD